jgi:hypothetical protein
MSENRRTYRLTDAAIDALRSEMWVLWIIQTVGMFLFSGATAINLARSAPAFVVVWVFVVPYDVVFWTLVLLPVVAPTIVVPLGYYRRRRAIATWRLFIEPEQITLQSRPGRTQRVQRQDLIGFTPFDPDQADTQHPLQIFASGQTITLPLAIEPAGLADLRHTLDTWQGKSQTRER